MANLRDFKARFIAAIEATGDPLAPIKLQDAHGAANRLGHLMANVADETKVNDISMTLLSGFPDEMDHIACDPSFLMAVCAIFENAIVAYASHLTQKERPMPKGGGN